MSRAIPSKHPGVVLLQTALLFAFFFYSMVSPFSSPETVICIGEEGHVAIENARLNEHTRPLSTPFFSAVQNVFSPSGDSSFSGCTDIPVFQKIAPHYKGAASPSILSALPAHSIPLPLNTRYSERLSVQKTSGSSPPIPSLRIIQTVFLLI